MYFYEPKKSEMINDLEKLFQQLHLEIFYNHSLAQAAYYLESEGEAAVVDPLRDIDEYVKMAANRKARIKYIFLTHFHADFVAGHLELQKKTGAKIVMGPGSGVAEFPLYEARDGERINLGSLDLEVIHTPGHTLESSIFLVRNARNEPLAMFTGDMLFNLDVGRPDLAVSENISEYDLGKLLFQSVQKLKKYQDDIVVLPGHGFDSPCGKIIGEELITTLGEQKKNNYAFQIDREKDFIETVLKDQPQPPAYFFHTGKINKKRYTGWDEIFSKHLIFYDARTFKEKSESGDFFVLDTRSTQEVEKYGAIPGSVNIGLDGNFEIWVGTFVRSDDRLLLIVPEGRARETIVRLARIGYENVEGILAGGIDNWKNHGFEIRQINFISHEGLKKLYKKNHIVLDVRSIQKFQEARLDEALHLDLYEWPHKLKHLDKGKNYLIYCQTGYRSLIAASLLLKNGFPAENVLTLRGGMDNSIPVKKTIVR